jgi:uncharacterized membrane protein
LATHTIGLAYPADPYNALTLLSRDLFAKMLLLNAISLLIAATAASPIAEPIPEPATVNPTSVFCAVVTGLVTKAKAQP